MTNIKDKIPLSCIVDEMESFGIDHFDALYNLNEERAIIVFSCIEDMHLYGLLGRFKENDSDLGTKVLYAIQPNIRNFYSYAKKKREHQLRRIEHGI